MRCYIRGNPQCVDGVSGKAFNFNGSDDFIETVTNLGVNFKEKTLVAWVKLNDLEQQGGGVVGIQSGIAANNDFDSIVYGEKTQYHWWAGSSYFLRSFESPFVEKSKQWVLMTITYRDSDYRIYQNASLIGNTAMYVAQPFGTDSTFYVGKRHGLLVGPINAQIDEARLYNRVLSASEIQQLYSGMSPSVVVKPYTFTTGSPAKAAEVNADFDVLYTRINALNAIVCQDHPTASICQ